MKILHINGTNAGGGLEQYLAQVFMELDRRRHNNILLYGEHVDNEILPLSARTFIVRDITHFKCDHIEAKLREVRHIIDTEKPDIVFIHQVLQPALIEYVTRMLPSVRFVHGFKLVCPDGRKMLRSVNGLCKFPLRYFCQVHAYQYRCMPRNPVTGLPLLYKCRKSLGLHRKKSYAVVASRFMKNILIDNGFPEAKINVIPYFTYLPHLETISTSDKQLRILALGRITKEKGFDYLLRAYSTLQNRALLTIVGDGPELMNLKLLAEERGISSRVTFPGWLSHDQLDQLYRQCSLVVVPSIWPEPFGIVGIEAMAYEKPVIAFDVGGISDWLKNDETGYLVTPQDESQLAARMIKLLDNPTQSKRMGIKGREMVERNFISDIHVDRLLQLFKSAMDQFSPKSDLRL